MSNRLLQFLEYEERRKQKIENLLSLLRDPDLADVVAKLVEDMPRSTPAQNANPAAPQISNGNGHKSKLPSGATAAIRAVGPLLPVPFTIHDVIKVLTEHGYEFVRKPSDVVRDAIYFMLRRPNCPFRVITRGEAGELSTYEYVRSGGLEF